MNPTGEAAKTNLCVGDRILRVNDKDMRTAMHHDAVNALISTEEELKLMVRHDPPPPGIKVSGKSFFCCDSRICIRSRKQETVKVPMELA